MPSDIKVFVRWKDQTIFAGENVECTITFKNVAENTPEASSNSANGPQRSPSRPATATANNGANSEPSRFSLKSPGGIFSHQNRRSLPFSPRKKPPPPPVDRSHHRASASVSGSPFGAAASHSFPPAYTPPTPRNGQPPPPGHRHKRSVSIYSIESDGGNDKSAPSSPFSRQRPPARHHGRSASLQVLPRRNESEDMSAKAGRSYFHGLSPIDSSNGRPLKPVRTTSGISRGPTESSQSAARRPALPPLDFRFPPTSPAVNGSSRSPSMASAGDAAISPVLSKSPGKEASSSLPLPGHLPHLTRIMSSSSQNGSNRSSGEFYSVSGHSSETLESEYTNYSPSTLRPERARHTRNYSNVESTGNLTNVDALLMGYAQISASFTVDGSLVNQSAFEEVKRKGVVGSQENGVGVSSTNGDSGNGRGSKPRKTGGLLGALGLNSIEESISGLLSKNDLDGLRDMRGVASSKSIPLLSTSQSLLFVDLRLAPGEEQSYMFSFTLPRGLPASHKGKAIKINYNLIIGTQRPSGSKEPQRVNRINIPFRVFSGVNNQGDILSHDLMSPYAVLRDEAKVQKVGPSNIPYFTKQTSISAPSWTSAPDFLSYVDEILESRTTTSSSHEKPFSPSSNTSSSTRRRLSNTPQQQQQHHHNHHHDPPPTPLSCKDAIDLAILRSNQITQTARSPNRFEIARNGRRIAVIILNRPAHRLGETVLATINFQNASLPCYALRAVLETSEKVSPDLAVRSDASIHRTTRKCHASCFENTLFATRVVFCPAIPVSATPTILTSGVDLVWELRFEFVTTTQTQGSSSPPPPPQQQQFGQMEFGNDGSSASASASASGGYYPGTTAAPSGRGLLEPVSRDDRGSVLAALENLSCESFEIAIPLTVYGETVRESLPEENDGYSI